MSRSKFLSPERAGRNGRRRVSRIDVLVIDDATLDQITVAVQYVPLPNGLGTSPMLLTILSDNNNSPGTPIESWTQSVFEDHDCDPLRGCSSTDTVTAAPLIRSFSTVLRTTSFV